MPRLLPLALGLLGLAACSHMAVPEHEGPKSDHFDGERFFNPWQNPKPEGLGVLGFLKWRLLEERGDWPDWVQQAPGEAPPARVTKGLRITFVGHATLLVQVAGLNLLTDPVWAHRIGPTRVLSLERRKNPGIRFDDLPPIDAVLVSHNHYDHLDALTLRRIEKRDSPRIFAGLGTRAFLLQKGIRKGEDLDWWQSARLSERVSVTAVPAQHWSIRWIGDARRSLWCGFVIDTPEGKIYFAGDTGFGPFVQDIRDRVGPIRYGLLPIGAYKPRRIMQSNHADPSEAVRMHQILGLELSVPMHYGTFRQTDEAYGEELADLRAALRESGLPEKAFAVLREGQSLQGGGR